MSLQHQKIRGVVPPLITPLKSREELDVVGLKRLIEYQLAGGVAGLFILGTTGEAPSLSYRLRREMTEKSCEIVAGRVPVLVGVTDTALEEAVEHSKFAKSAGATAVVSAAPYYFSVGQDESCDYLLTLADTAVLPLFAYNIPSCVNLSLSFETIERLTTHPNICGLKDSAGDLVAFRKLLELRSARPDWTIFMGYESLLAESVLMGSDGAVPGGAVLHPRLFVDSFHAAERRDQQEINRLQIDIARIGTLYSMIGSGASGYLRGLKAALEILEICAGELAMPFRKVDEAGRAKVAEFVRTLGIEYLNPDAQNG